jgi:DNA-binding transcriptional regulator YiaG
VLLSPGDIARPVDLARLLVGYGLSLRKAHDVLDRIASGSTVAVEVRARNRSRLEAELSGMGITAKVIEPPVVNVKRVREHFGLSQEEFALRFGFEVATVRNWEQGRNAPDPAINLLLKLIETYPEYVESVLTSRPPGSRRL